VAAKREPRKKPKQGRSRELVDAVVVATGELAAEQGLEALTMPQLSRRSGVSLASIYEYFPTKDAVIAAWAERVWEQAFNNVVARVQQNVAEDLPVERGVRAVICSLNAELRPFAKAFQQCRYEISVGRPARRAELTDSVTALVYAALTAAPRVVEATRVQDPQIAARVVATLLCADTYIDLLGSNHDPEAVDAAVATMVSLSITG